MTATVNEVNNDKTKVPDEYIYTIFRGVSLVLLKKIDE